MFVSDAERQELDQLGLTEEQSASITIGLEVLAANMTDVSRQEPDLPGYFLKFLLGFVTSAYSRCELPVMSGFDNWFLGVLRSSRELMRQTTDGDPALVFIEAVKQEMLAEYLGSNARILNAIDAAVEASRTATANDATIDRDTRDKVLDLVRTLARQQVIAGNSATVENIED